MKKVFLSSVIRSMEEMRAAGEAACESMDIEVVKAEDFPASPSSPRGACLSGVRDADAVLLLLGERYGDPLPSGKSATEEELEEARRLNRDVLVFRTSQQHEPRQQAFLDSVSEWQSGQIYKICLSTIDLQKEVTRALRAWSESRPHSELDSIVQQNLALVVPGVQRGTYSNS